MFNFLEVFRLNISPYLDIIKQKFDDLVISGDFIGSSSTYDNLPTTSIFNKGVVKGDWAYLESKDGDYKQGVYVYDGSKYVFKFALASDSNVEHLLALVAFHDGSEPTLSEGENAFNLDTKKLYTANDQGDLVLYDTTNLLDYAVLEVKEPKSKYRWSKASSSWVLDEVATVDDTFLLGQIDILIPNPEHGVYELDGSTIVDAKLARFIESMQSIDSEAYPGFTIDGDSITLPDWSKFGGEVKYSGGDGSDDRGLPASKVGKFVDQAILKHNHSYSRPVNGTRFANGSTYGDYGTYHPQTRYTSTVGSDYNRVFGRVAGVWCIVGTRSVTVDGLSDLYHPKEGSIDLPILAKSVKSGQLGAAKLEFSLSDNMLLTSALDTTDDTKKLIFAFNKYDVENKAEIVLWQRNLDGSGSNVPVGNKLLWESNVPIRIKDLSVTSDADSLEIGVLAKDNKSLLTQSGSEIISSDYVALFTWEAYPGNFYIGQNNREKDGQLGYHAPLPIVKDEFTDFSFGYSKYSYNMTINSEKVGKKKDGTDYTIATVVIPKTGKYKLSVRLVQYIHQHYTDDWQGIGFTTRLSENGGGLSHRVCASRSLKDDFKASDGSTVKTELSFIKSTILTLTEGTKLTPAIQSFDNGFLVFAELEIRYIGA